MVVIRLVVGLVNSLIHRVVILESTATKRVSIVLVFTDVLVFTKVILLINLWLTTLVTTSEYLRSLCEL